MNIYHGRNMLKWLLINCLNLRSYKPIEVCFSKTNTVNLYKYLFTPQLKYESLVWGTNTKQIEILQKIILRIITNSSYLAHTESILKRIRVN